MTWLVWTLVSIGVYLVCGVITATVEAYWCGATEREYKVSPECAIAVIFWPLVVTDMISRLVMASCQRLYELGQGRDSRREVKETRQAFLDLCEENGWDPKQAKTLVE